MPRIAILKTGRTYPSIREQLGDFEDWFIAGLAPELDITVVDVESGETAGAVGQWDGIVVTGSPAMVTERADWSENTAAWLARAVAEEVPVLGVCYGHQLLAHSLGGEVDFHPRGRETGTRPVQLTDAAEADLLFRGLPRRFAAQLTHRQSVIRLPEEAVLLAANDFEPHQAFRVGRCAWGVQFHPEFSAEVMRAYLAVQAPELQRENLVADELIAAVDIAREASSLLARFSELVLRGTLSAHSRM